MYRLMISSDAIRDFRYLIQPRNSSLFSIGLATRALTETSTGRAIAGYALKNTFKMGASFGGMNVFLSDAELFFGGSASNTNNKTLLQSEGTNQQATISQKSNSITFSPNTYTISKVINTTGTAFAQGFAMGSEYAGAF